MADRKRTKRERKVRDVTAADYENPGAIAAGTAAGLLNIPDGFDKGPGGTTPTHPATG